MTIVLQRSPSTLKKHLGIRCPISGWLFSQWSRLPLNRQLQGPSAVADTMCAGLALANKLATSFGRCSQVGVGGVAGEEGGGGGSGELRAGGGDVVATRRRLESGRRTKRAAAVRGRGR